MEKDYQKDIERCKSWLEKPWNSFLMDDTKDEYWLDGPDFMCPDDYCYFTKEDAEDIVFARTELPQYVKRCMELEAQKTAAFGFINELIKRFEETPLSEDGTHRLIVDRATLERAKKVLAVVGC